MATTKQRTEKNAKKLSDFLFDKIMEIDTGVLAAKDAEQMFNGAGKWINLNRLRVDARQLATVIGEIDELAD